MQFTVFVLRQHPPASFRASDAGQRRGLLFPGKQHVSRTTEILTGFVFAADHDFGLGDGPMSFPDECYGPETLDLMTRALHAAWEEVGFALDDRSSLRAVMALRIIAAVHDGECDLERLKELALDAVVKAY